MKDVQGKIPTEIIMASFKKCCISNVLDDAVFLSYNKVNLPNKQIHENDNIYDNVPIIKNRFDELIGNSGSESEFKGAHFHV